MILFNTNKVSYAIFRLDVPKYMYKNFPNV